MVNSIIKNAARFIILVLLQLFLFNNIEVHQQLQPFFYILFIIYLPFGMRPWMLFLYAFLIGITIDNFSYSPGLHAGACVFMAFMRYTLLPFFEVKEEALPQHEPHIRHLGIPGFITYAFILTFLHHSFLMFAEVFSFSNFADTLYRTALNTFVTVLVLILTEFLFYFKRSTENK